MNLFSYIFLNVLSDQDLLLLQSKMVEIMINQNYVYNFLFKLTPQIVMYH